MSSGFTFTITTAGLDALVDAQNGSTDAIQIVEVGVSPSQVDVAPTLTALPGETKRIGALAGQSASETIIHMTAIDSSADAYDVRSMALYLSDGTLFAAYSRAEGPVFRKVDIASFLFSIDIAFGEAVSDAVVFGDASFAYPPATESIKGVAELATQQEVNDAEDDTRIVTPLKLGVRMDVETAARVGGDTALQAQLTALLARTITGSGLITGGGDLSGNRVLQVLAASAADIIAGTAGDRAITPAALGPIVKSLGFNGYISIPTADPARLVLVQWGRFTAAGDSDTTVTFPMAFTQAAFAVLIDGTNETNTDGRENAPRVRTSSITASNFRAFTTLDSGSPCTFIAIGEIDNS